jgi:hypothetical protein
MKIRIYNGRNFTPATEVTTTEQVAADLLLNQIERDDMERQLAGPGRFWIDPERIAFPYDERLDGGVA